MAVLDSVTVSIAALTRGIFRRMVLVSRVPISTSFGSTDEKRGTRETSSKVKHSMIVFGWSIVIFYLVPVFCFIYQTIRLLSTGQLGKIDFPPQFSLQGEQKLSKAFRL